jgi:hypothetical protein
MTGARLDYPVDPHFIRKHFEPAPDSFQTLFERMRRELGRRHIEPEGTGYRITEGDVVRGQITDDRDSLEQMPLLIIDGKPITWEEPGRMVAPYARFRFKLGIFDRSEEK